VSSGSKDIARREAKARRQAARAALGVDAATLFARVFFEAGLVMPGAVVAGYMPKGSEADPQEILRQLALNGHRLVLPRVEGVDCPLAFLLWAPGQPLVPGVFGTFEPNGTAEAMPALLLVPLLAFDGKGHRLGYGGGFYDRTLAALRRRNRNVLAVGLAFSAQEVTHLPHEPEDEPLDWIVTEHGARAFSGQVK
jgi:5-formyltetrahydrofolate cyclo-ligase